MNLRDLAVFTLVFSVFSLTTPAFAQEKMSKKQMEKMIANCLEADDLTPCETYVERRVGTLDSQAAQIMMISLKLGQSCYKDDADACVNAGLINTKLNGKKQGNIFYKRACDLGNEEGCEALK